MPETDDEKRARKAAHLAKYRWQKGQSGNPGGRKPGAVSLVKILKEKLAGTKLGSMEARDGETVADKLVEAALIHFLQDGNPALFREFLARIDGKQPDVVAMVQTDAAATDALNEALNRVYGEQPNDEESAELGPEGADGAG